MAAVTVIAFGLARFTAPWMMASTRSPSVTSAPRFMYSSYESAVERGTGLENASDEARGRGPFWGGRADVKNGREGKTLAE